MEVEVFNLDGEQVGTLALNESVFGLEPRTPVIHQAMVAQLANRRQGTADTKTRGQVRGGGKKPWRQKGTGRARQGSRTAPHWTGGGVVFGPHPRDYSQKINKKMRRLAIRCLLSSKVSEGQLTVVDEFTLETPRTRDMLEALRALKVSSKALLALPEGSENVVLSARNIPGIRTLPTLNLNVLDLLNYDRLILTMDGVRAVERWLATEEEELGEMIPVPAERRATKAVAAATTEGPTEDEAEDGAEEAEALIDAEPAVAEMAEAEGHEPVEDEPPVAGEGSPAADEDK